MLDAILYDADFWAEARRIMLPVARRVFREAYLIGAALGARETPRGLRSKPPAGVLQDMILTGLRAIGDGNYPGVAGYQPIPDVSGLTPLPFDFEAISTAAENVIGEYSDAWWAQLETSTRESLRRTIQRAEAEGLTMPQIIAEIEPLFGPERAARIAVSETTTLLGQGAQATYQRAGFGRWVWRTVRDARVDPLCDARARESDPQFGGTPYSMTRRFERAHVGCLLPGSVVSGASVEGVMARLFDGDVVVIRTASGNQLSVTPNHPILTPRGWIAAGSLREGHQVIEDARPQWVAPLIGPDDVEMPARVEEVTRALLRSGGVRATRMPVSAEDFHGDGADGEVDVVWASRDLRARFEATICEPTAQNTFAGASAALIPVSGNRASYALSSGGIAASRGFVSGRDLCAPLFSTHARPFQALSLRLPARFYAGAQKPASDRIASDAIALSERVLRGASKIEAYQLGLVVSVEAICYTGHVYNLQTKRGYYSAGGIVTQNCRCWSVPYGPPTGA